MRSIYFFTSPLCEACEAWKPTIDAFVEKHHATAIIIRCNPNLREYKFGKWTVKYTPSAVVTERGEVLRYVEGKLLTLEQLEHFAFGPAEEDVEDTEEPPEEAGEEEE